MYIPFTADKCKFIEIGESIDVCGNPKSSTYCKECNWKDGFPEGCLFKQNSLSMGFIIRQNTVGVLNNEN